MNKNWFEIKAAATVGARAQVYIFGVIVDYKWDAEDVTAKEFLDAINPLGDFDLRINSPGGSVTAGNAMYNGLRRHQGRIDVYIEGIAASMASVVAMAGTRIIMPANAMMMIHDPWSYAVGNSSEMRKSADILDKMKIGMVAAYADKSGMETTEIEKLMTAETWITAAEAVKMGFADEIEAAVPVSAHFDLSRYNNVPQALLSPPPRVVAQNNPKPGGDPIMKTVAEIRAQHPDLVTLIETEARAGMVLASVASTAQAQAVSAESTRVLALVSATLGAETGDKITAIVNANLSAEQVAALGITVDSAIASRGEQAKLLAAITAAAPNGVGPASPAPAAASGISTSGIYANRQKAMHRK